jgi:cardiolipin synthase
MLAEATGANCNWLCTGQEFFSAMLEAIETACESVCLETYIYSPAALGQRFRDALVRARQRGAQVQVLVDALGSYQLPANFWDPLRAAGGEARRFNPLSLHRLSIRNHRKLLVCDRQVAFVGGFNIAPEYEGDGVTCGWCDLGLKIQGSMAARLEDSFHEMFARADLKHKRLVRLRRTGVKKAVARGEEQLLFSGPGRERSPIKRALRRDLVQARTVQMMMAYFLPSWRIRRQLASITRGGGQVQLVLASKTDVTVALLAAQSLYRRLLKSHIEIFEYQPQILHAKLIIINDAVYVGSANLDQRSLNFNYELMVRFETPDFARQAREVFQANRELSRQISIESWRRSRSLWQRLKQHWAYWLLVRIDPYIARRQWRALPD